ncbi:MAG TPA: polysaccharide deacetylase family protein [Holophagaceae bacterium]|jgi:peptidoglycan/xylan/chitin deacetylase (PgdA/CDA1 family)|nr:polysaccharide deacetylase family protein [Holophagaceae bacterium]
MRTLRASSLLALAGLLACGTSKPPAPTSAMKTEAATWSWHRMGDYIVIDGELDRPTQLALTGPSTHVTTAADFGPVHWELRSPLAGEPISLKDADGRLLASWVMKGRGSDEAPLIARVSRATAKAPARPARVVVAKTAPRDTRPSPKLPPESSAPIPVPLTLTGSWPGAGGAFNLTRGPRNGKVILLSFDGGSSDEAADEILSTLEARNLRTTVFLTGAFIERFPEVVRRIVADGHEVGNHTFDHPHFAPDFHRDPRWGETKVQDELLRADEAFFRLTGRPMDPLWRSPYGENTKEIRAWAEAIGYRHVGWSEGADSLDWATPKERRLYRSGGAILDKLHARMAVDGDGLVVLMHLGSGRPEADRPAAQLGAFIDQARAEGWRFVTASEMLRLMGQPAWDRDRRAALLQQTDTAGGR